MIGQNLITVHLYEKEYIFRSGFDEYCIVAKSNKSLKLIEELTNTSKDERNLCTLLEIGPSDEIILDIDDIILREKSD